MSTQRFNIVHLLFYLLLAILTSGCTTVQTLFSDAEVSKNSPKLAEAALQGDIQKVQQLLDKGATPNSFMEKYPHVNEKALRLAAEEGHIEIVKLLINAGADIINENALRSAAKEGHIEIVKLLINAGANIIRVNGHRTALMEAAREKQVTVVQYLVDSGADVNLVDEFGFTALSLATIGYNNSEVINILVDGGANIDYQNYLLVYPGRTALIGAVFSNRKNNVETLINLGADINIETSSGETALVIATRLKKTEIAEILLRARASQKGLKEIELILAAEEGDFDKVKGLIEEFANVNAQNSSGYTALIKASIKGHTEIVNLLLSNNADPNVDTRIKEFRNCTSHGDFLVTSGGYTALHFAVQNGHMEIVESLLKAGANVNERNHDVDSPVLLTDSWPIRGKITLNANVKVSKKEGRTVLMIAAENGYTNIVKLLIETGTVIDEKDIDGNTALTLAQKHGYNEIVSELRKAGYVQQDWKSARSTDTISAYEELLRKHPQGHLADQARARLEAMKADLNAWENALQMNTIKGYANFLERHPNSPFADKAAGKIVDLEVSNILSIPHGQLPSANRISGEEGRTYSVLNIHNNTEYNLTIRYSGPESFKIVFSPGEKGSVEVLRGTYRVVASVDAPHITDYAGQEDSDGGNFKAEYYISDPFSVPRISLPGVYSGSAPKFEAWPSKRKVPDYLK